MVKPNIPVVRIFKGTFRDAENAELCHSRLSINSCYIVKSNIPVSKMLEQDDVYILYPT